MRTKLPHLLGLIALSAVALPGQPTNGPVYWSTTVPDCSTLETLPVSITNSAGTVIGYSCYVSGTFIWLIAGGGWSVKIRAGAPATAPIGVDYTFYDNNGNNLTLDTTNSLPGGSTLTSNNEVDFALSTNQPLEVDLLGATSNAPNYAPTTTGTVYAVFYCPDATTCSDILPQLIYAQPATHPQPGLATVPISWDSSVWTQWSAEGVDDGTANNVVSFVVYNQGTTATTFNVDVFDGTGALVATGTTPLIPPLPLLSDGYYGEAGTYGADLRTPGLITSGTIPTGVIKILIDGGTEDASVQMFQIAGPSLSSMQVAYDASPGSSAVMASAQRRAQAKRVRSVPLQKQVFGTQAK
jgi:hypothetical protein